MTKSVTVTLTEREVSAFHTAMVYWASAHEGLEDWEVRRDDVEDGKALDRISKKIYRAGRKQDD